ncbi:MAG: UDP-2,3-diacylglucosamine hydrolase, partial [Rickettsiales bacterium]|nr:UDP-2,3-diacylglucosamine hydrolase [Rickettsiales bacterium]
MDDAAAELAEEPPARHYRTIWISDIHLGTKDCKAEYLL